MVVYHVDGIAGNDGNSGLSRAAAFKTLAQAINSVRDQGTENGKNSDIIVWRGYFTEGGFDLDADADDRFTGLHIIAVGPTTVDGESTRTEFLTHRDDNEIVMSGIRFFNFTDAVVKLVAGSGVSDHKFINCAYVAEGGLANTMEPHNAGTGDIYFENCDFYKQSIDLGMNYKNCIASPDGVFAGSGGVQDYNASSNATFRGTSGIDTGVSAAPFLDIVEGQVDLAFDSGHGSYATYRDGGEFGIQVGATWFGAFFYHPEIIRMGFIDHPVGAYVNDPNYYDPSFPSITIVASTNDNLQYNYNATGESTVLLTPGTYTDPDVFAAMIQGAINVGFPNGATFVWNANTKKFTWASNDAVTFTILIVSGSLASEGAYEEIGFSLQVDKPAVNNHPGDYAVTEGLGAEYKMDVKFTLGNGNLDFTDDSGSFTVIIANTTDTPQVVADAIKTAMEAVSGQSYVVEYGDTDGEGDGKFSRRFLIRTTTSSVLTLPWNTGGSGPGGTGLSVGPTIGYDDSADDTGALSYLADLPVTPTIITFDGNGEVQMDLSVEPNARSARVVSPVFDILDPSDLKVQDSAQSESGASVVDSTKSTAQRDTEYRGNSTEFSQTDAETTTTPDWTNVQRGRIPASVAKRYWQRRETLRVDGTP